MSDNLNLPSSHLSHFDVRLLLHEELAVEQVDAYVAQCSPLLTPATSSGAASPMPSSSPRPSPRATAASTNRTSELKRKLAGQPGAAVMDLMPPTILAHYLRYASQQPTPTFSMATVNEFYSSLLAAAQASSERWTAPVLDSVFRLAIALARLQLSKEVTTEHIQVNSVKVAQCGGVS